MSKIIDFISRFKGSEHVFLYGCCYWFAFILSNRFYAEYPEIMYEPVEGHFVTKINGRYYDVRGDVTDEYCIKSMYRLEDMAQGDSSWYRHLMRDCRDFERVE